MIIYMLDTTVISDLIVSKQPVTQHFRVAVQNGDMLGWCQPIYYEAIRGLIRNNAARKIAILETMIVPFLVQIPLADSDWLQAARFWAEAQTKGKQLSDIDLLIASIAHRLDAVIASSDDDFDILPVKRNDWRISP